MKTKMWLSQNGFKWTEWVLEKTVFNSWESLHLLITFIQNLGSTLSIYIYFYSEFSMETCLVYYNIELPNLKTCAHVKCQNFVE